MPEFSHSKLDLSPQSETKRPTSRNGLTAWWALGLVLAASLFSAVAQAAPPSCAALLPGSTKGFVSTTDLAAFSAAWDQTQFGQLMLAPEMQPFADDLKGQLRDKWAQSFLRLGVTWEDVQKIAGGECCTALVWEKDKKLYPHELPASVFLIDVTGKVKEAEELLARVAKDLLQQKAKRSEATSAGAKISVFDAPKRKKNNTGRYVYFLKDNLLCACDVYEIAAAVAVRLSGKGKEGSSLEKSVGFKEVMNRCEADAASAAPPQARWFIVPVDFMEARRMLRDGPRPPRKKSDPLDNLEVMRHQGFAEINGAGAYVHFDEKAYDIYQRVAVYAPQPFKLAERILDFPNDEPAVAEKWVPTDIAACGCSSWNVPAAFEASKTLFDEFYGLDPTEVPTKGKKKKTSYFEDAINGFKNDPNGPKVDLRADLMKHLGPRTYFITDYARPITPSSELRLFATEIRDQKKVAAAVERLMKNDEAIERIPKTGTFGKGKHVIWRVPEDEPADDVPSLKVENVPDGPKAEDQKADKPLPGQEGGRLLANSYICVAHGYLLVGSSLDLLKKALRDEDQRKPLAEDPAYQQVEKLIAAECSRRGWTKISYRRFSRTDEEFESTYELTRQGKMPESESMLGQLLSSGRGDSKDDRREQRIDGSKMPPYNQVRGYFAPSGWVGRTETKVDHSFEGWFMVNFTQRKAGGVARAR